MSGAWEQIYGLLVEDGQLAIGTLLAFAVAAAVSVLGGTLHSEALRNSAGPILFVLLMSLLLVNLYAAGRRAYPATPATSRAAGNSVPKK